jgi:hypothetical protein
MRPIERALVVTAIFALLIAGAAIPAACQKGEDAAGAAGAEEGVKLAGLLYCVEFRGPCGPPVMPSFLASKIVTAFDKRGMKVTFGGQPPLISREDLKYSMVVAQGETDLRTGRIYADVGPGSELTVKNAKGTSVVLQVDISQVCWDLDRTAAVAGAKLAKSDHALLARFQVDDLTSDANPHGELGRQKSVRVNLELIVTEVSTGEVVAAFSEECRQMDLSLEGAIAKGAKYLTEEAAKSIEAPAKEDTSK